MHGWNCKDKKKVRLNPPDIFKWQRAGQGAPPFEACLADWSWTPFGVHANLHRGEAAEFQSVIYGNPEHTNWHQDYNKNWKSLAFDVIRTLGMSNQIIFYNLQIIWLLLSIDLDT